MGRDFASTVGVGGVLGTKFTWPDYGPKLKNVYLNSDKETEWKKWIAIYNQMKLSRGDFRDLYIYGYDVPEAYADRKGRQNVLCIFRARRCDRMARNDRAARTGARKISSD